MSLDSSSCIIYAWKLFSEVEIEQGRLVKIAKESASIKNRFTENCKKTISLLRCQLILMYFVHCSEAADGVTPLHLAACQGNEQCLHALLTAGAVVDAADSRGRTPYYLSRIYGHKRCSR